MCIDFQDQFFFLFFLLYFKHLLCILDCVVAKLLFFFNAEVVGTVGLLVPVQLHTTAPTPEGTQLCATGRPQAVPAGGTVESPQDSVPHVCIYCDRGSAQIP